MKSAAFTAIVSFPGGKSGERGSVQFCLESASFYKLSRRPTLSFSLRAIGAPAFPLAIRTHQDSILAGLRWERDNDTTQTLKRLKAEN